MYTLETKLWRPRQQVTLFVNSLVIRIKIKIKKKALMTNLYLNNAPHFPPITRRCCNLINMWATIHCPLVVVTYPIAAIRLVIFAGFGWLVLQVHGKNCAYVWFSLFWILITDIYTGLAPGMSPIYKMVDKVIQHRAMESQVSRSNRVVNWECNST